MTDEIFRNDSYIFEFEAEVTAVDDDNVILGGTAFYPGGGGQVCDTGSICGTRVTEVKYIGNDIVHKVPGNKLKVGDKIWCSVDWDRRYDLMKGHTAEHLLFNSLYRQDPDIHIVKIFISPENKYVIIDRDIEWKKIRDAVTFANSVIADNVPVIKSIIDRNDPDIKNVRINLDRVKEEEITVIEIGDIDAAACSGIHVMETSELGAIFVDKKVSAGKDGYAIHFRIGNDATNASMDLANSCLQIIEELGSKPEDVLKTVTNMKRDLELTKKQLKATVNVLIKNLKPVIINGVNFYSGTFPAAEHSVLTDAAESYKNEGSVAAFIGIGDSLSILMASGNAKVNCKTIISESMSEFNGRGGGKPDFAQGGIQDISVASKLIEMIMEKVKNSLS